MPVQSQTRLREAFTSAFSGSFPRRAAFGLLLAWILAAPFPWASVQPGLLGVGKLTVGAFVIAALAAVAPDTRLRPGKAWLPVASLVGVAILGAFQIVPLQGSILRLASPASADSWEGAAAILGSFGMHAPPGRVSLMPWETAGVTLLVLAYIAAFLSSLALLEFRAQRRLFGAVVLVSGGIQIIASMATDDRLSRLSGSFVNPNHFAGYLTIPLALAFAFLWFRTRHEVADLVDAATPEAKYRRLERLVPRVGTSILLWAVFAVGIGFSQSRGGILAAVGGSLLLIVLSTLHRRDPGTSRRPLLAASLAAAIALGTVYAVVNTGRVPILRFMASRSTDIGADYRVLIWQASPSAWRLFPWFGSGLGCYREAFRRVQPPAIRGLVDQAHNEYLQILVTGGVVGASFGAVALVSGVWLLFRGFLEQRHREESAFVLGGLGALGILLLHGAAEFNFSIPAIPATLAAVLGCAWAAAHWQGRDEPAAFRAPRSVRRPG